MRKKAFHFKKQVSHFKKPLSQSKKPVSQFKMIGDAHEVFPEERNRKFYTHGRS